jgi:hypothetical protein
MSCSFRFPCNCSLSPRQEVLSADITANQSCLPVKDGHARHARGCHSASNKFLSGHLDSGPLYAQTEQLQHAASAKQQPNQGLTLNSVLFVLQRRYILLQPRAEVIMQNGSVIRKTRKMHSDIWQFRWREKTADGKNIYRRRQIGTVEQIPDLETARKAADLLVPDLNARMAKSTSVSMNIAQLCSHFEQCELSLTNTWRSYSTKTIYKVYLKRWIIPKWSEHLLSDIRTIEVESWLRSLPIARSTCAKIRNVMSVLFNHACRYELFDGNPIRLVRQSAKRRSPPVVLTAGEIRILLEGLEIRERTLVFIAASTGIRQSELFALKWGDINFTAGTMNVRDPSFMVSWDRAKRNLLRSLCRSIPWSAKHWSDGKNSPFIASRKIGFLRAGIAMESDRTGDKQFCTSI